MELTKNSAITVSSADPIRDLFKAVVEEAADRRKYLGRKVTAQAVVNGLILLMGSLPADERSKLIDGALELVGRAELDAMTVEEVQKMEATVKATPPPAKPKGRK